ncbi:MAG: class I SAM-dependent methyltransferase [Anaerolineaceae bacterium]|nr:class I SAM-dependent methyltransferase [Anaerolineaceae bacterium]
MQDDNVKANVRQFYDRIGWQMESDGFYQNARYEDLRPVARDYIHDCHLRVKRHLKPEGRFLLDAGSGPIQYPEYLTYSEGYQYRVCVDLSIVALQEAAKRTGDHGLFVVADVANLPFTEDVFDGVVSLHTIHHVPGPEKGKAYRELYRVMLPDSRGVVVNGWTVSRMMVRTQWLVRLMERIGGKAAQWRGKSPAPEKKTQVKKADASKKEAKPTGTFIQKQDPAWLEKELQGIRYEIWVWRSVSVRWLRAIIHRQLAGRMWLRLLYWLEEQRPHYFGKQGQYPLVVIRKDR